MKPFNRSAPQTIETIFASLATAVSQLRGNSDAPLGLGGRIILRLGGAPFKRRQGLAAHGRHVTQIHITKSRILPMEIAIADREYFPKNAVNGRVAPAWRVTRRKIIGPYGHGRLIDGGAVAQKSGGSTGIEPPPRLCDNFFDHARSNRSAFITLVQAATKSRAKAGPASAQA